jgi:predicted hydrocarbon binding protein
LLNSFYDKFIFTNNLQFQNGSFKLINMPFMIVPVELMIALIRRNDPQLNLEIYYSIKESTTRHLVKQFDLNFGLQGKKGIDFLETFFTASGWGTIHETNIDPHQKRAMINVTNSPFALHLRGKTKIETDHYLRGILAGIFTTFFNTNVDCVETECMALGSKNCKFIIKTAHEFNLQNPATRRQLKI